MCTRLAELLFKYADTISIKNIEAKRNINISFRIKLGQFVRGNIELLNMSRHFFVISSIFVSSMFDYNVFIFISTGA